MANQFTHEEIYARYDSLPADIQEAISGSSTATILEEIGRSQGLRLDAIGILIEYSGLVMLGLIKSKDFVSQLERVLSISREQAEQLAIAVDNQVFSRIRNSLREVQHHSPTQARFETADDVPTSALASSEAAEGSAEFAMVSATDYPAEHVNEPQGEASALDEVVATESREYSEENFGREQTAEQYSDPEHPPRDTVPPSTPRMAGTLESLEKYDEESPFTSSYVAPVHSTTQAHQADIVAHTPPINPRPELIKDFQTKLEEKVAQQNNSQVNNDPYKESI